MKVIATYNIKGGVGKTTAAVNLAYLAAQDGFRTLLWDLDPQAAATYMFRVRPRVKGGGKALIRGTRLLDDAIKGTDFDRLDLLPGDFTYRNMDLCSTGRKTGSAGFPGCSARWPPTTTSSSSTARPASRWCRRTCARRRPDPRPAYPAPSRCGRWISSPISWRASMAPGLTCWRSPWWTGVSGFTGRSPTAAPGAGGYRGDRDPGPRRDRADGRRTVPRPRVRAAQPGRPCLPRAVGRGAQTRPGLSSPAP